MKKLLLLALFEVSCSSVLAQTDDPGCNVYVSTNDTGCSTDQVGCNFSTGCTSSNNFTMACNGTAWIKASVNCSGTPCRNCGVCVNIYTAGTGDLVYSCNGVTNCDEQCCIVCSNYFLSGSYVMRVCIVPCPGGSEQACCTGNCSATGIFSSNSLSCP